MTPLQHAQAEANKYKQIVLSAQYRAAQNGMPGNSPAINLDAAPAPMAQAPLVREGAQAEPRVHAPGPIAQFDPWAKSAQNATSNANGAAADTRRSRELTPGPGSRVRAASHASVSPGGVTKVFLEGPATPRVEALALDP